MSGLFPVSAFVVYNFLDLRFLEYEEDPKLSVASRPVPSRRERESPLAFVLTIARDTVDASADASAARLSRRLGIDARRLLHSARCRLDASPRPLAWRRRLRARSTDHRRARRVSRADARTSGAKRSFTRANAPSVALIAHARRRERHDG